MCVCVCVSKMIGEEEEEEDVKDCLIDEFISRG